MDPLRTIAVVNSLLMVAFGASLILKADAWLRFRRRNLVRSGLSRHPIDAPASRAGVLVCRLGGVAMALVAVVIGTSALLGSGAFS